MDRWNRFTILCHDGFSMANMVFTKYFGKASTVQMIMSLSHLSTKFSGSVIGSALGDAIGKVAFVGMDAANLRVDLNLIDSLFYTDDTAMAIGLAETLASHGRLHEQAVGDALRQIYRREPWRGYRLGTTKVFGLVEEEALSYGQAAARLRGSAGAVDNGAATRVAPVGLFFANAPDLYEQAALSAGVTHAHPVAIDGAAVLAKAIAQVVPCTPATPFLWQPWLRELIAFARTRALREQLQLAEDMFISHLAPEVAFEYLGRGNTVPTTLPFALYTFLCHPTSFADCILRAVTHGGERDALGAMAGAIAGAYLGIAAIPVEWRAKLENECYLARLARTLAGTASLPWGEASDCSSHRLGHWN